jgi:hypothetical protein
LNTLLVIFGAFFALLYALAALIQTVRRRPAIRWFEIALIFLVVFLPLIALALEALETSGAAADQDRSLLLAAIFGIFGFILIVIELFRPQRLRQSRGLLTIFSALLLGIASLLIPFLIAYFSFVPDSSQPQPQNSSIASKTSMTSTPDEGETFLTVFGSVINVVAEESDLSNDEVLSALDGGQTVADIVSANGGNLDTVVDQITVIMQDFLRELMQQNRLDRIRGAAGIASMRLVVEYAVNNDLGSLTRSGQENADGTTEPTLGEGTPRESYFSFLTTTMTPEETSDTENLEGTLAASDVATITALPTSRPTQTRTPRPTATATPTRELFSTRTPSPTPTLPSPCLLLPLYNVNLRETPALDAPLILTVPYETALNAYGRNEDTSWWYVEYEGSAGWVKAEYVSATSSCELLPVRRP